MTHSGREHHIWKSEIGLRECLLCSQVFECQWFFQSDVLSNYISDHMFLIFIGWEFVSCGCYEDLVPNRPVRNWVLHKYKPQAKIKQLVI